MDDDDLQEVKKCPECDWPVQENGECPDGCEPCYYCPDDGICRTCGRGTCDQSC